MSFKSDEIRRLLPLKSRLFSRDACEPGTFDGKYYDHILQDDHTEENLHSSIRDQAIAYFGARSIPWHGGHALHEEEDLPSGNLLCSQSHCVNVLFPFRSAPKNFEVVLAALGYDVAEVLLLPEDHVAVDGHRGWHVNASYPGAESQGALAAGVVAFEWIGVDNYLSEGPRGRPVSAARRRRGTKATSADFVVRFRREDGCIQVVLGEWKYSETYKAKSVRISRWHTDRAPVYRPHLEKPGCQIALDGELDLPDLMYDPFDQMMRAQLLASEMERAREMDAYVVSYLHIAPRANGDLMKKITAPKLVDRGADVHEAWASLVKPGRFKAVYFEDLLPLVTQHAPDAGWAEWMRVRYGGMA